MYEEWRTIPGVATHEVSNFGRVRSKTRISEVVADGLAGCDRVVTYKRVLKGKPLKLHYTTKYIQVSINDHGESVHRLVAKAFLPPPRPDQTEINHKDGNKLNNVVTNLEWCNRSENELHKWQVLGGGGLVKAASASAAQGLKRKSRNTPTSSGRGPWNKGKPFPNEIAHQHRRESHAKLCLQLLDELEAGATRKELAAKYNKCYRQICDNLNKARKLRLEQHE